MKLIRIFLLGLTILLPGCGKKEEEKAKEIELITQTAKIKFLFPPGYVKDTAGSSLIRVVIKYPEMIPNNSTTSEARKNQITIFIEASDGIERTEMLIKEALPYFDYYRQGLNFYAGKKGIYDVYKQISDDKKNIKIIDTIVAFKSNDGVVVGVSDRGNASYIANRRFNKNIHLQYLISRNLGENFLIIDTDIKNFITQHVK